MEQRARNADSGTPTLRTDTGMNSSLVCQGPCHQLEGLLRARTALALATSNSIERLTDRITALLPDIMSSLRVRRRKTRGLLDFVGDASSFLFWPATNSDVGSLRTDIRNIKACADAATTDSARTREGMSTFARLQNSRLDAMRSVLDQEQKTLEVLYREVTTSQAERALEHNILSHAMLELASFVDIHDGIMELELGVEDLIHGQLTPKLISVDQLYDAMQNVSNYLAIRGQGEFRLCHATPQDVYANPSYDFARYGRDLFIRLRLPYTRQQRLNVYRIHTFPMRVPGPHGFSTEIQDFPRFVVTNLAQGDPVTAVSVSDICLASSAFNMTSTDGSRS